MNAFVDEYIQYWIALLITSTAHVLLTSNMMPSFHRQAIAHIYRNLDVSKELCPRPSAMILEFKKRA